MASKSSTISLLLVPCLLLAVVVICPLGAFAHNITQMLGQFPDYTKFNNLLTQTQIAPDINSRRSITVLAVNDSVLSAVSGQPMDVVKKILQVHVALDYYDADKLKGISGHSAMMATLFQASGQATEQNGFLNVSGTSSGQVAFGSAASGSRLSADFVQVLVTHPYNISVIQVGNVIIPPGIGLVPSGGHNTPASSPAAHAGAPNVAPFPASLAPKLAPAGDPNAAPIPASLAPKLAPAGAPNAVPIPASLSPKLAPAGAPNAVPIPASLAPKLAPVPAAAISPKTGSPAASPSSTLTPPTRASPPTTDDMAPSPFNGASEDPLSIAPSSDAPMMSPPAPPGAISASPAGSPSNFAGSPGPAAGDEGPKSAAVRVVIGSGAYVAVATAMIVPGIL